MTTKNIKDAPIFYRLYDLIVEDSEVEVGLERFVGIKQTECGWWVADHLQAYALKDYGGWLDLKKAKERKIIRWVSDGKGRRHCYTDFNDAVDSYLKRKHGQLNHGLEMVARAESVLKSKDALLSLTPEGLKERPLRVTISSPRYLINKVCK